MAEKKNIMTYAGLKKLEDELQDLKVNRRQEVAEKIREAREQGDLSENAEYEYIFSLPLSMHWKAFSPSSAIASTLTCLLLPLLLQAWLQVLQQ